MRAYKPIYPCKDLSWQQIRYQFQNTMPFYFSSVLLRMSVQKGHSTALLPYPYCQLYAAFNIAPVNSKDMMVKPVQHCYSVILLWSTLQHRFSKADIANTLQILRLSHTRKSAKA